LTVQDIYDVHDNIMTIVTASNDWDHKTIP